MTHKVYKVTWWDSSLQNGEVMEHELPRPVLIVSAGHVTAENEQYICLTRDVHDDGGLRGALAIPVCAIESIDELRGDGVEA